MILWFWGDIYMSYNEMELLVKIEYVNNRLAKGESIRTISTDLKLNKSTISSLFKKNGYIFSKESKSFVKSDIEPTVQTEIVANKPSLAKEDIFKIPTKTKKKIETKAFNVVMKLSLVDKIDEIAKSKGYSRNQIISIMCNLFVDNYNK